MQTTPVDLACAVGKKLAIPVFEANGRKLLPRGRKLCRDEAEMLRQHGIQELWVMDLETSELGEDEALGRIAPFVVSGAHECRENAGYLDYLATAPGVLIRNSPLVERVNSSGQAVVVAGRQFSWGPAGTHIARFRTRPFAVDREAFEHLENLMSLAGPCLEWRPFTSQRVGVLYLDPISPERARDRFAPVVQRRLGAFQTRYWQEHCVESEELLQQRLSGIFRRGLDVLLIASTTCPADPGDVVARTLAKLGTKFASFLAPVEPGSLLMLGFHGRCAVVSAPGCFRSHQPNVLDFILPPLLASYPLGAEDIAVLGSQGLLLTT